MCSWKTRHVTNCCKRPIIIIATAYTDTEVNNCFSIYHTIWITNGPKSNFICDNIPTKALFSAARRWILLHIYANEQLGYELEISIKTIFLSISVRTFSTSFHVQDVMPVTLARLADISRCAFVRLSRDRNSHIYQHLQQFQACRGLANNRARCCDLWGRQCNWIWSTGD